MRATTATPRRTSVTSRNIDSPRGGDIRRPRGSTVSPTAREAPSVGRRSGAGRLVSPIDVRKCNACADSGTWIARIYRKVLDKEGPRMEAVVGVVKDQSQAERI